MFDQSEPIRQAPETLAAKDWVKVLAKYREPNALRSWFEVAVTVIPFLLLGALAWWAMSVSSWLAVAIAALNGGFLLRLFTIQHDCGHGSFLANRSQSDWLGRILGVVTLTPYDCWRHHHSIHHSASGNLERRGIGDIHMLTLAEYEARSPFGRWLYRLYRNPLVLFGIGPGYVFFLENRLPLGLMTKTRYWISAMGTNLVLFAGLGWVYAYHGLAPLLLVFLPTALVASTAGVWLFFVQHNFETSHWDTEEDWQLHEAALHGSSHYVLPAALQWLTANIGIHHVHHLYSRIPFYRLPEVLRDHKELAEGNRMTIRESISCASLHLWDEKSRRFLSFAQARNMLQGASPVA